MAMTKRNRLMEGYEAPSAEEEAAYERFYADRLPSLGQLELFPEAEAPPSMALSVLSGRQMKLRWLSMCKS